MIRSMTAFSRIQKKVSSYTLCWEVRSVNHRYLEMTFRLPEGLRFMEGELRAVLRQTINRGKIECQLKMSMSPDSPALHIDDNLATELLTQGKRLAEIHQLANDLTVSYLLNWPGMVNAGEQDIESSAQAVQQSFAEAVDQLAAARRTEGQMLTSFLQERIRLITQEVAAAKGEAQAARELVRDKLLTRLQVFTASVDNVRIEQEISLLLTRMDVTEELDRLSAHLLEVARIIEKEEVAGRRLDFFNAGIESRGEYPRFQVRIRRTDAACRTIKSINRTNA